MKFITLVAALAAAVSTVSAALTINTPSNVVECQPTQITWSGGQGPYYLAFTPPSQPSAPAIKTFPTQSGTSYTWLVDLPSGTSFTIVLKDSTGAVQYSDIVTITAGTSTTCLSNSVQETGTGGSGAASTGSSGSTAAATSAGSGTTTASSSTSTQSGAASRLGVSSAFGVAGVMGLVGAALF